MSQELTIVIIFPALQKSSSEGQSSPHNQQQGGSVSNEELDKLRSDYSDKKQQVALYTCENIPYLGNAQFCLILVEILAINRMKVSPYMLLIREKVKSQQASCALLSV